MEPEWSSIGSTDCAQLRRGLLSFFLLGFFSPRFQRKGSFSYFFCSYLAKKYVGKEDNIFSCDVPIWYTYVRSYTVWRTLLPPRTSSESNPRDKKQYCGEGEDAVMVVHGRCGGEREGKED